MSASATALTPDCAAVNRANAEHSTGPRTPEGKQRSAMNAVRHGLTAKTPVLPGEDPQAYQEFRRKMIADIHPKGMLEEQLAQSLADIQWRLNTCVALTQQILDTETDPRLQREALYKFGTYEHRLRRDFLATLNQLRELQEERKELEKREMKEASRIMKHWRDKKLEYDPAEDGFVFSAGEVSAFLRRTERYDEADWFHGIEMNNRFFKYQDVAKAMTATTSS